MAIEEFMNAPGLSGFEWTACNRFQFTCPIHPRLPKHEGIGRTLANGQTDIACRGGCSQSELLFALRIRRRALMSADGSPYVWPEYGWWRKPGRYTAGPLRSMEER